MSVKYFAIPCSGEIAAVFFVISLKNNFVPRHLTHEVETFTFRQLRCCCNFMACVGIGVSMTARKQPYLGPTLSPQLENSVVWIEDASPTGPAAGLADTRQSKL